MGGECNLGVSSHLKAVTYGGELPCRAGAGASLGLLDEPLVCAYHRLQERNWDKKGEAHTFFNISAQEKPERGSSLGEIVQKENFNKTGCQNT